MGTHPCSCTLHILSSISAYSRAPSTTSCGKPPPNRALAPWISSRMSPCCLLQINALTRVLKKSLLSLLSHKPAQVGSLTPPSCSFLDGFKPQARLFLPAGFNPVESRGFSRRGSRAARAASISIQDTERKQPLKQSPSKTQTHTESTEAFYTNKFRTARAKLICKDL